MAAADRLAWLLIGAALGAAVALLARPGLRGLVTVKHPRLVAIGRKQAAENFKSRWRCGTCGLETNSGGLGNHQKYSGHSGRTRVDDNGGARPDPRTAV